MVLVGAPFRVRAAKLGWYPSCSMTVRTRARVSGLTCLPPLMTRETVPDPTPAKRATSARAGTERLFFLRVRFIGRKPGIPDWSQVGHSSRANDPVSGERIILRVRRIRTAQSDGIVPNLTGRRRRSLFQRIRVGIGEDDARSFKQPRVWRVKMSATSICLPLPM